MRYRVRQIAPGSALRVGCLLGWLVALCPGLCLAGLVVQLLQRVDQALARVEPIEITLLGQELARIDLLEILRLSTAAQSVERLVDNVPLTFALIALLLVLAGALVLVVALLLFSVGYNVLASLGGGLEIELREVR